MAERTIKVNVETGQTINGSDRMHKVNGFFLCLYAFLTLGLCCFLLNGNHSIGRMLLMYCLCMISLFSIHLWIYMARRFYFGMRGENGFFRTKEFDVQLKELWEGSYRWFEPCLFKSVKKDKMIHLFKEGTYDSESVINKTFFEVVIKLLYLVGWIGMCWVVLVCVNRTGLFLFYESKEVWFQLFCLSIRKIHIVNFYVLAAVLIYLLSMFMNYHSFFMCMAFTAFIRSVANHSKTIQFNYYKPSNTLIFHRLIHASSRVAIAFFCDSMLYVILTALDLWIGEGFGIINRADSIEVGIITACVVGPCILSFIIVFLLPKAFLSRLLRNWKIEAIEKMIAECDAKMRWLRSRSWESIQEKLNTIYTDRLPLVKVEVTTAVAAVAVDAASIILTLKL